MSLMDLSYAELTLSGLLEQALFPTKLGDLCWSHHTLRILFLPLWLARP